MNLKPMLSLGYWLSFIKFNLVGLSGVVVNLGLFTLFYAYLGFYYVDASAVAIELSIISNFFLNDFWTFRDRRHGHLVVRLLKFNGLMLIGLVVNVAVVYLGTSYFHVHPVISQLLGIGVAFLARYEMSVKYAWIKKEEKSVEPAFAAAAPA